MAPSTPHVRALAARRPLAPALAALGFAAAILHAACSDDPEPISYLGAGGAPPPGSVYGPPFIPNPPGTAGAGQGGNGEGGSRPGGVLRAAPAARCVTESLDLGTPALSAVGSLGVQGGTLEASFGGDGYLIAPSASCLAGGTSKTGGFAPTNTLPSPLFAWTTLADQKRVAVTAQAVVLLPAGSDQPLTSCPLPAVGAQARRRASFDPSDPLHVWVVDGGSTLYERRLSDEPSLGCTTPDVDVKVGDFIALRDVAARPEPGRVWLAVITTGDDDGSLAQIWDATVNEGAIEPEPLKWPDRSGPCAAGGLLSADAIAALPDGAVAVADGGCGAVVRLQGPAPSGAPLLTPLDRTTLFAGDAPRALAVGADGALFIASAIERLPGSRINLWRAPPPAVD